MANLSNINNKFLVTTGGNVGIGTTSPSQKLDTPNIVIGGSSIVANYRANSTMMDNLGGIARFYSLGPNTSTGGSYQFNSLSSNLTAGVGTVMTILNTGNVGIGTTSPGTYKLNVAGTGLFTGGLEMAGGGAVYQGQKFWLDGGGDTFLESPSSNLMTFTTGGTERMRIESSGNVQIGASSQTNLSLGSSGIDFVLSAKKDGTDPINMVFKTQASGGTLAERMRINSSGELTVGGSTNTRLIITPVENSAIYLDARDGTSTPRNLIFSTGGSQRLILSTIGDVYNYQSGNKANTYYGYNAGNYAGTGTSNTAMGYEAGGDLTTGTQNTVIGRNAGDKLTTGVNNTCIGMNSGFSNVDGQQNTYIGAAAGYTSPGQNYNTFVGREAGYYNATNESTAVGRNAMHANTSGLRNVALGFNSLTSNQTGNGNTALGYKALISSTSDYNVGIGDRALAQLTTGQSNIAIGTESGFLETTGSNQIFIGFRAGYNINNATTASGENVIIGHQAAVNRTGGTENVFIGSLANYVGVGTGSNNVVVGRYAGAKMTSATRCTFLGHQAGAEVTTGPNNTFIGKGAGDSTSTGSNNTHIGQAAGDEASTGDYNICIGHGSGSGSSPFQLTTESGRVVIGDNSIGNAYIKVDWTITSDKRDKTEFKEIEHGLDFVNKLKPTEYKFRKHRETEETDGIKRYGFLAQDILELEEDNPVIIDVEQEDSLKYKQAYLVPILVKAIQELKAEIDELKK